MAAVSVREIFENMDYGNVTENLDLAKAWISRHGLKVPKTPEEIETTVQNCNKQSKIWAAVPAAEKAKLLNKLAAEIETHNNLICQVELFTRQILTKDTKNKSISLITDYLRYYSGWSYLIKSHLVDYKPYGLCAAYLTEATPLATLGAILAPILAAGNELILGVSSTLIPITCLIVELCKNVGFPEGLISIIEAPNFEVFMHNKLIEKIAFVGNLYEETISNIQANNKKCLTTLHLQKSSGIIFDSADIDSAVDNIVEFAWSYKCMFGINKIFVQESIFQEFTNKLTAKISKLNVGYLDDCAEKTLDIIIPNEKFSNSIKVDIVNKIPLQIGYKTFGGNILSNDDQTSNILSILAFRTANEAVALCNNSKFGLATSIWTENVNLANEVSNKLKCSIVWINTHGHITANNSFGLRKSNGQGYFGGKEGLLEYMTYSKSVKFDQKIKNVATIEAHLPSAANNKKQTLYYGGSFKKSESGDNEFPNKKDIRNCVEVAKKSQEAWSKISTKVRAQILLKLADTSQTLKIKNTALVEKFVESLREWAVLYDSVDSSFQKGNPELKVTKETLGVIVIDVQSDADFSCLKLLISAIISGNSVIVVNYAKDFEEFLLELCKIVSSSGISVGVFNVIFNPNEDVVNTLLNHREISMYFNTETNVFKQMQNVKYLKNVNCNSFDILNLVTHNKCIWTSFGESFL